MNVNLSRPTLAALALAILSVAPGCGQKRVTEVGGPVAIVAPEPAAPAGCVAVSPLPELGTGRTVAPGVVVHEIQLTTGGLPGDGTLWVYLPEKPSAKSIPCVLIGACPNTLIWGHELSDHDRPEHLYYARAGFAVVAYAVSGSAENAARLSDKDPVLIAAAREYRDADVGLADARRAFDYLAAKIPAIDAQRVYAVGHDSAGTLALLVAEHEPRLAGCVAFAPLIDVEKWVNGMLQVFNPGLPGYGDFVRNSSPLNHTDSLRCPLLLFQTEAVNQLADAAGFVERIKLNNADVTFLRVPTTNYDPETAESMPRVVRWLKEQSGKAH
jgi:dienelactone hydrolase